MEFDGKINPCIAVDDGRKESKNQYACGEKSSEPVLSVD